MMYPIIIIIEIINIDSIIFFCIRTKGISILGSSSYVVRLFFLEEFHLDSMTGGLYMGLFLIFYPLIFWKLTIDGKFGILL